MRRPSRLAPGRRCGSLTLLSRLPGDAADGVIWSCRCDCGEVSERRESNLLSREASGYDQHCRACAYRQRNARYATHRSPGETRRAPVRICHVCASLAHRVSGRRCGACGLVAAPEAPAQLDADRGLSSWHARPFPSNGGPDE